MTLEAMAATMCTCMGVVYCVYIFAYMDRLYETHRHTHKYRIAYVYSRLYHLALCVFCDVQIEIECGVAVSS